MAEKALIAANSQRTVLPYSGHGLCHHKRIRTGLIEHLHVVIGEK
ncbi:hypothetical protein QFZ36_002282 [Pseudarthrobacter siccitolerans]|uniref:Uncharacterized protein n=1 Tax=Pseudarthrobacter siccitolerans TaxID=861266 RepID=A0ABU0PN82_9MICC|nr:hypothetical protein [Pseudarthrobacter siccitolerans]MDQ0674721.1 hypothetical protein [Pseudarthrobacter siccitolerans]